MTARAITGSITASNKVYDSTTTATISGRTLSGVLGTDTVSYPGGAAVFDFAAPAQAQARGPAELVAWIAIHPNDDVTIRVARAEMDVRSGGNSCIVMRSPDGQEFPNPGVYLEVVPNERIVFTDAYTEAWKPSAKNKPAWPVSGPSSRRANARRRRKPPRLCVKACARCTSGCSSPCRCSPS